MTISKLNGGEKLLKKLAEIERNLKKSKQVKAGFLSKATYPDGTKVAYVAALQNYGDPSSNIPPRPFMDNMIHDKSDSWGEAMGKLLKKNNYDITLTLGQVGEGIIGQIVRYIDSTNNPPNAPVTNLLKQRFPMGGYSYMDLMKAYKDIRTGDAQAAPAGKPLVWTGFMRQSVDYEVK